MQQPTPHTINCRKPGLNKLYAVFLLLPVLLNASGSFAQQSAAKMSFVVSMEQPVTHYYNVTFHCEGLKLPVVDFKMPAWTPGYYRIMNFAKNVASFAATDENGKALSWQKTNKNTWRVQAGKVNKVTVTYRVYSNNQSVADPFLDTTRAYLSPTGIFMHVAGRLREPVKISVQPYHAFTKISTGLDPVKNEPNTFFAPDFDALYDCPLFMGQQYTTSFRVQGIPHYVVFEKPADFDTEKLAADLKRMVEAAVQVVGDIPYKHYHFIIMGAGQGGLEHRNSTAVFSGGSKTMEDNTAYKNWLAFLTHEYFHLYNIKAIRPVALGPFDYDQENYTNMLWVSEGFTVYYEYLILNRAGLLTREQCLNYITNSIRNYENSPGHLLQSATQSSFDTWINFFNRSEHAANNTISYYDKGCALGMLLDLAIRHHSNNKYSLDHVMTRLYKEFYIKQQRGFTDEEFQQICEATAGVQLRELFDYAATTKNIDYPKYMAYAGLMMDTTTLLPGKRVEKKFDIRPLPEQKPSQRALLQQWLKE
jgi:predicted metalloprotease with PDZ domain